MKLSQKILKNIIALTSSYLLFSVAQFVFNIIVARFFGDFEFGKYSFALAFTSLFVFLSHMGLDVIVTRDLVLDKSKAQKYFSNVLVIEVILSVATFLLIAAAIALFRFDSSTSNIIFIIAIGTIITSLLTLCRAIFRAFERMEWNLWIVMLGSIVLIGGGIFILGATSQVLVAAVVFSTAQAAMLIFSILVVIKKFTPIEIKLDKGLWIYLGKSTIPFAMNGLLLSIYNRIDIVLITTLRGEASTGWYNAAYLIGVIPLFNVITGISGALFPTIVHAHAFDMNRFRDTIKNALKYFALFLVPVNLIVIWFSSDIIALIFGSEFVNSGPILQILFPSGSLLFLNFFYLNIMEGTGRQKITTLILAAGAVLNTCINLILIPIQGGIGSAFAALITQVCCLIAACYFAGRIAGIKTLVLSFWKPLFAAGLTLAVALISTGFLPPVAVCAEAVIVYVSIIYAVKGITGEDVSLLLGLFRKKNN